jgi:hypothetical protein
LVIEDLSFAIASRLPGCSIANYKFSMTNSQWLSRMRSRSATSNMLALRLSIRTCFCGDLEAKKLGFWPKCGQYYPDWLVA